MRNFIRERRIKDLIKKLTLKLLGNPNYRPDDYAHNTVDYVNELAHNILHPPIAPKKKINSQT